jgi:PIN domain nuclease of toxin-antitoxin system
MTVVLDASALLAYLKDEPGSTAVDRVLCTHIGIGCTDDSVMDLSNIEIKRLSVF